MTAIKFDRDKPDYTLLPYWALEQVVRVFEHGAQKYGRYNYRQGMEITRYLAAAQRHLAAVIDGVDTDSESGLPHLAHVCCNCLMALINQMERPEGYIDNRHKTSYPENETTYIGDSDETCIINPS